MDEHRAYQKESGKRDGERSLGMWISNRRQDYKKGKLSRERVDAIEALPGWK